MSAPASNPEARDHLRRFRIAPEAVIHWRSLKRALRSTRPIVRSVIAPRENEATLASWARPLTLHVLRGHREKAAAFLPKSERRGEAIEHLACGFGGRSEADGMCGYLGRGIAQGRHRRPRQRCVRLGALRRGEHADSGPYPLRGGQARPRPDPLYSRSGRAQFVLASEDPTCLYISHPCGRLP